MARTILALCAALTLALPAEAAKKKKAKPQEQRPTPVVTCKDGSQSPPVRGACLHHGGIDSTVKPVKDSKDPKVTPKGNGAKK
jgi:hypothetical protein